MKCPHEELSAYASLDRISHRYTCFGQRACHQLQNEATVSTQTTFAATANTTTCSRVVAAMGVYVDNSLRYVVNGTKLNTSIALTPGKHNGVVQEWDYCCGATKAYVPFSVAVAGGVYVTSPTRRSTIAPLANYVASATSTCPTVNYEMDGDRYQTATTSYVDKLNLTYE